MTDRKENVEKKKKARERQQADKQASKQAH